jgi:hypothetical protein
MTIYVSQCEGYSHNNQHDQLNQDSNQDFDYLPVPLKFYMVSEPFKTWRHHHRRPRQILFLPNR